MTTISTNELRQRLADLINRVAYSNERTLITRHGRPVAALISAADLEALEALEDRLDLEAADTALADADAEEAGGRKGYYTLDEIKRELEAHEG